MTLVKICGITNLDDARAAIKAGADLIGFNFYRPSPRYVEPELASVIIDELRRSSETVVTVGVFVNESSPEALVAIAGQTKVDAIQLHGDETVEFCRSLKALGDGRFFVIKVLSARDESVTTRADEYDVDAIMLDAFDERLRGGTGRQVDLKIAERVAALVPRLFLAGGLAPENVAAAVKAVGPYAVDACSALETAPGKKDAARMRAFVEAARSG